MGRFTAETPGRPEFTSGQTSETQSDQSVTLEVQDTTAAGAYQSVGNRGKEGMSDTKTSKLPSKKKDQLDQLVEGHVQSHHTFQGFKGSTRDEQKMSSSQKKTAKESEQALRECVMNTKVFDELEAESIVGVLMQPRDLSQKDELEEARIPLPLVFTQIPKHEGPIIAEAFHHAWSNLGCGKMFFTKTSVRVRPGRKRCFTLWAGSDAGPHLFPWGFFDPSTRDQDVPDLDRIIGIRGYLPFGACRFLASGCSYATVLLDPVARFLSHAHWVCTHEKRFKECDLSVADFTKAAQREVVSFDGIDNYQTRMLVPWFV